MITSSRNRKKDVRNNSAKIVDNTSPERKNMKKGKHGRTLKVNLVVKINLDSLCDIHT